MTMEEGVLILLFPDKPMVPRTGNSYIFNKDLLNK